MHIYVRLCLFWAYAVYGVAKIVVTALAVCGYKISQRALVSVASFCIDRYSDASLITKKYADKALIAALRKLRKPLWAAQPRIVYAKVGAYDVTLEVQVWYLTTSMRTCYSLSKFLDGIGKHSDNILLMHSLGGLTLYKTNIDLKNSIDIITETDIDYGEITLNKLPRTIMMMC